MNTKEDRLLDEMRDLNGELDDKATTATRRIRISIRIRQIEKQLGKIYDREGF